MGVTTEKYATLIDAKTILVRGTNWIGDVIMSLPAITALRESCPQARITVLAKPWVADVYELCGDVDDVMIFRSPGIHDGIAGKVRLARELQSRNFDVAILLQNAIEAAIITALARIPLRAGYNTDGRGLLLTHPVRRKRGIKELHQVEYYLEMVRSLGVPSSTKTVALRPHEADCFRAEALLRDHGIGEKDLLIGLAPGAAYGPAKMWFPERFAAVADRLADASSAHVLLFGSGGDAPQTQKVRDHAKHSVIDLAGKTSLRETIALMARCSLFISNDSGLMHIAGALNVPLIAIFGSTNPVATSPPGENSIVIRKNVSCSPCLKKTCPTDFRCMDLIGVDEVCEVGIAMLSK